MKNKNFVFPDFNHSIVNLAATLADFLGKPICHPVLPKLKAQLKPTYKNIVYMVIDAMGSQILAKNLPENALFRTHEIDTVTSVFPSTTAAATTSLTTALTPAEHGWFVWAVDFDGAVIELFRNRNFYTHEFTPDSEFVSHHLPVTNFFEKDCNRTCYSCFPDDLSSPIRAEHEVAYKNLRQMYRKLHKICQNPEQKFIYAYYSKLDTVMHSYGTTARQTRHLLKTIQRHTAHLAKRHPDTLFIITADHGQTDLKDFTYIYKDAAIQDCLEHPISLDPRGACFKIKSGKTTAFQKAFAKYQTDYTLVPTAELIQKGVFGNFQLHPDYQKYLGDFIAIGNDTNHMLLFKAGDEYHNHHHLYHGIHTGMSAAEMMVPVIVLNGGK